jgi:DNA-binding SARP family transcriptional activator
MIARLFAVLSIAAFSVTISVWSLEILWKPVGYAGLEFKGDTIVSVDPGSPGERAGLHVGDRFDPKTPFFVRQGVFGANQPFHLRPAAYSFSVLRNGATKHVTVSISPHAGDFAFTGPEGVLYAGDVLVFLISALIGTVVVLVRPSRLTWMFFLFCIGAFIPKEGPIIVLLSLPMPLGFVLNLVRSTLVIAGLFAFAGVALRFPSDEARGWRKQLTPAILIFAIAYWVWGTLVAWIGQVYFAAIPTLWAAYPDFPVIDFATWAILLLVSLTSLLGTYRASEPETRQRLKWTIFGVAVGYTAVLGELTFLVLPGESPVLEGLTWATSYAMLLAPLAIAYAIFKGRVVDPRFVVNRAVVYFSVTLVLAVVLSLTFWLTSLFLQQTRTSVIIQLLVTIVAGVFLQRLYRQLDTGINRLLFRRRYEALEHLERLAGGLSRADSIQEFEMLIASEPVVALDLTGGALFRRTEGGRFERTAESQAISLPRQLAGDEPLITRLRVHHEPLTLSSRLLRGIGSALHDQPLALAVPLYVDDALYAVVTYGPHENGSDLDPTEKSAIAALQAPAERGYAALQRHAEKFHQLSMLLEHAPNDASDDLHVFLAGQVIDAIPERTRFALLACSAIPVATADDAVCATENPESAELLREFARTSRLIQRRDEGTFAVHGLVARAIMQRFADQSRDMVVRCARRSSERGDRDRAARLFELAGFRVAAAKELESSLAEGSPAQLIRSNEDVGDIAEFDIDLVKDRPHLWIQRSAMRLFRDGMRAVAKESAAVRNATNTGSATPGLLAPWCAYLHVESGELGPAIALLESSPREETASFVTEFRTTIASLAAGRLGRLGEAGSTLDAVPGIQSEECRALNALVRASTIERARGRWNQERAGIDAAIDALKSSGSRFLVWALAEGVVGAWLVGQERARLSYLKRLAAAVEQYGARTFTHLAAVSRAEPCDPTGVESPRWLAWVHVMAACSAPTWQDARARAALALDAAVDAGEPFLQLLARIASAEFDEENRYEHFRRAFELSKNIDSAALADSVRAFIARDERAGVLERFVGRLRQDRDTTGAPLVVELAGGCVRRGAQPVALSERELALTLALACSPKSTSTMELVELIWPDLDESAGAHAVQTCVHRLRQRLGDTQAIQNTPHGYRLRNDILVDLTEIESFMQGVKIDEELDELTALRLAAVGKYLDGTRPAFMTSWEWFAPFERRIQEWSRIAKHRLAVNALRRGAYDRALALAQQIIARDELDEPAWEIVLRVFVETGDRVGAQRELRRYREITLRELNAEPSRQLYDLVESMPARCVRRLRVVGDRTPQESDPRGEA